MAEPVIILELNDGTEGTPTWTAIGDFARWVGAGAAQESLNVPHLAPIGDADEVFFDDAAAPHDGELWNEIAGASNDVKVVTAGRNTNLNVMRMRETGAADGTVDPPEATAYDDATDGQNRTAPGIWVLAGTTGSSSISCIRGCDSLLGVPTAAWTGQVHDADPFSTVENDGRHWQGDVSKTTFAALLAASGNKTMNLSACLPHDATAGITTFVYQIQYTWT